MLLAIIVVGVVWEVGRGLEGVWRCVGVWDWRKWRNCGGCGGERGVKKEDPGDVGPRSCCGEDEIRTRETLWAFTRFPGVPLQPLEHLSLLKAMQS